jgi:hypothetical protein
MKTKIGQWAIRKQGQSPGGVLARRGESRFLRFLLACQLVGLLACGLVFAGTEGIQTDTQADILRKLTVPAGGSIEIKNSNGQTIVTIASDGTLNIAAGSSYKIGGSNLDASDVGAVGQSGTQTITGTLIIK